MLEYMGDQKLEIFHERKAIDQLHYYLHKN